MKVEELIKVLEAFDKDDIVSLGHTGCGGELSIQDKDETKFKIKISIKEF